MLGYAMVFPLLPLYADRFGAGATTIGLLVASFSASQVAASPLWGRLSDRFGRRPALMASLFGSAAGFTIFAFADSIALLFLSRIIQGGAGGTTGVMQAYVGDTVTPDERAKALGWLSAATNSGVMIGPVVGSAVFVFGEQVPGLLAGSLCLGNVVFAWWLLPESRSAAVPKKHERRSIRSMIWETVRHPTGDVPQLIWIYAVAMTAFGSMTAVLAIYLKEPPFLFDESTIGYVYLPLGAVSVIMRGGLLGHLVSRFREVKLMNAGALLLAVGLFCLPFPETIELLVPVMVLMPIGTALLFPATSALVTQRCDPKQLGQMMGVQQAFGGVARIVGPIWAGAAFAHFGPAVPFQVAGIVVFVVALLTTRVRTVPTHATPADQVA